MIKAIQDKEIIIYQDGEIIDELRFADKLEIKKNGELFVTVDGFNIHREGVEGTLACDKEITLAEIIEILESLADEDNFIKYININVPKNKGFDEEAEALGVVSEIDDMFFNLSVQTKAFAKEVEELFELDKDVVVCDTTVGQASNVVTRLLMNAEGKYLLRDNAPAEIIEKYNKRQHVPMKYLRVEYAISEVV